MSATIPVKRLIVKLKCDTEMVSEYEGRGIPARTKMVRAGTEVLYTTFPYAGKYAARNEAEITHWRHTVTLVEGRTRWSAFVDKPVQP